MYFHKNILILPKILKIINRFKIDRGVAQMASVLAWGARGREFESHHSDKTSSKTNSTLTEEATNLHPPSTS